ncbi:MAG: hypothetical protein AAFY59_15190, partial [Pseudomonadota bacterium]
PRLIVHIGTMKTGSSAIQRFFARNRAVLPAFGVHYPKAQDAEGRPLEKHADLTAALEAEKRSAAAHPTHGTSRDVLARYLDRAAGRRATLLSAERLAAYGDRAAALFAGVGERFDVRVLVYLRRQDEWALSTYREHVMDPEIAEARPFAAWLDARDVRDQMDYEALMAAWRQAVGEQNIRVLRYPQETPLLPAFIRAADLPRGLLTLPFRGKRVKESVSDDVLFAQLEANGGGPVRPALTGAERDALMAEFQPGNYAVKTRFRPELKRLFGMD